MKLNTFTQPQLEIVNRSAELAEELVSEYYKLSESQWLRYRYDIKTYTDLTSQEIVDDHLAQVIRYEGQRKGTTLCSSVYDFYKICILDPSILKAIEKFPKIQLFPFLLYIVTHELVHIVRFSKFLQKFEALPAEKILEEQRVHIKTIKILREKRIEGLDLVLSYCETLCSPIEEIVSN